MSILDNYRSSSDYREILRILQKSTSLEENFLWQSHAAGKNIIPIQHFEIDFVPREVVIFFDARRFTLRKDLPLYVKLDYRTSVFKVTDFLEGQNTLHFTFPKEIKTLELRTDTRIAIAPEKERTVSLKPSLMGGREAGNEIQVRVMDISRGGLGLLVSEYNRAFLKNNRILRVTELAHQKLHEPVLAEVVYMNTDVDPKFQTKRQKELKVGLKLSGMIPEDIFTHFIQ